MFRNKFYFLTALAALPALVLGQVLTSGASDPTVVVTTGGLSDVWSQLTGLWIPILLGVYEVIVRYVPTVRSYSLLTWLMDLLRYLSPDRKLEALGEIGEF